MRFKEYKIKRLATEYKVDIKGLSLKQLQKGIDVESEHTGKRGKDTRVAKNDGDVLKIAVAHLREDPKYYTKLEKVEESLCEFAEIEKNHVLVVANEDGVPYNQEALKSLIKRRPKILQKENSYYKINLPSSKILVVNEEVDKLSLFDTCDDRFCKQKYKLKDEKGYVEWSDKLLHQSQIANFYANAPEEFFEQLIEEIGSIHEPLRIYSVGLNKTIKSFLKNLKVELI